MALIGQATAQIAHHLTDQLNILPLIQLMEREYAEDPRLSEFLSLFRESYHQIAETVQQLRRIVRFESIDAPPAPVTLSESIRELSAFLRFQKAFPWSYLRLDLRQDAVVLSSRLKLHHALVNLLLNAADAIRGIEAGRIYVRLVRAAEHVSIEVEDNGVGIPSATLPKIWDPLFSTKSPGAHGLGLHLVKRLVESDQGRVLCHSTPGERTVFTIQLPLAIADMDDGSVSAEELIDRHSTAVPVGAGMRPDVFQQV